jgi:hypothetical protein
MTGPGLCGVCLREVPVRGDGRLRAHLAVSSSPGRREQCDGSGGYSARTDLMPGTAEHQAGRPLMTRAAAFNAREEWLKADALYTELQDMLELGTAGWQAMEAARDAVNRAVDDARGLAPWWLASAYDGAGDGR